MRIAILTGASSGLGREYARQITAQDHDIDEVWAIARRKERLGVCPCTHTSPAFSAMFWPAPAVPERSLNKAAVLP